MILQDFYTGKAADAYTYFGAHNESGGFTFRVYAPSAKGVTVMGEFSNWEEISLNQAGQSGIYEVMNIKAKYGQMYHYQIYTAKGEKVAHCDPYGFAMEKAPRFCSILTDLESYHFHDKKYMENRTACQDKPLAIYEMHAGSWKRKKDGSVYRYRELGELLIPYLKENHFTHIELMPLMEYPFDGSWGYQTTGYFAPTSRYGTPDELKGMIDDLHAAGIGVILDFVPVHFAVDGYGLHDFDGTDLYEYPSPDVGYSEWGSCNFIHSRGEVASFLMSAARYWLKEFHFDGLRFNAVSRLLYWQGEEARGENGPAIRFVKQMNQTLKAEFPSAMLIAEDSTSFPMVTHPVADGGLGFDYKWDLGFMHDTLSYFQSPPSERVEKYHKLTFSMMYFYNERYLLPYSHDECVHGKATILQKMHGEYDEKFPQARAMYMYMALHPGKLLWFMGNEFGQLREWDETREQDWMLLDYPIHSGFHRYMKELLHCYSAHPAFWQDDDPNCFSWLDCHSEQDCTYAMLREHQGERLVGVFHFADTKQEGYTLEIPNAAGATVLLHSDRECYGGSTKSPAKAIVKKEVASNSCRLTLNLPPYSGILLKVKE